MAIIDFEAWGKIIDFSTRKCVIHAIEYFCGNGKVETLEKKNWKSIALKMKTQPIQKVQVSIFEPLKSSRAIKIMNSRITVAPFFLLINNSLNGINHELINYLIATFFIKIHFIYLVLSVWSVELCLSTPLGFLVTRLFCFSSFLLRSQIYYFESSG